MGKFKPLAAIAEEYEQNLCALRTRRDALQAQLETMPLSTAQYRLRRRIATLDCLIGNTSAAICQMRRYGK